ncbi:C40 family peptidase [Facklamia lactis]|uniref:C40 family peptidase n=1 Tax=Facklamia lactis TaxID=2749967 RepID=UPI0018CD241F|nr:C40 family peptidase [Facklamia lactis]MBG9980683.1 C40 family peptidase [Facklamia lactis]
MKNTFKKSLFKTLLTSAVVLSTTSNISVLAQDYDEVANEAQGAINNLTPEQTQLYAQLVNSYNQIESIKEEANELQSSIVEDDKKIEELNSEIEDLQEQIDKRQELIAEQAVSIQENGGATNYINAIASSDSISDFVGRIDVIRKLVSANKDLLSSQKEDKEAVEEKVAATEDAKAEKIASMTSLEALKGDLEVETAEAELAYSQLANDATLAEENRLALEAEMVAFETEVVPVAETEPVGEDVVLAATETPYIEESVVSEPVVVETVPTEGAETTYTENQETGYEAVQPEIVETSYEEVVPEATYEEIVETSYEEVVPEATYEEVVETSYEEVVPETTYEEVVETSYEEVVPEATYEEVVETSYEEVVPEATYEEVVETSYEEVVPETTYEEVVETSYEEVVPETTYEETVETTYEEVVPETTYEETTYEEVVETTEDLSYNTGSLIGNAEKYLGTPYVWGGKSPSGFDCSGFTQYVFRETYGMEIGGWTGAQESAGTRISVEEAQPGDLYFWGSPGGTYHVAIATGGGNYIHASQPGTPLEYNSIQWFTPQFAVRVL